ncbi:MAG TPA: hypothetical protein DCE41_12890 [Cytophagales bacterium]|nr:hypothetical protein [Cytophagales bacterium]HAP65035.1 hypothetical protein [Cytophagales bacterium]
MESEYRAISNGSIHSPNIFFGNSKVERAISKSSKNTHTRTIQMKNSQFILLPFPLFAKDYLSIMAI